MYQQSEDPRPAHQRLCLGCNRPLYGRKDKRHCNNRCKNKRHNQSREGDGYQVHVTKILKKNYRILQPLVSPFIANGMKRIPASHFTAQGFDFSVFTGNCTNPKTRGTIHWVFDVGWEQTKDSTGYLLNVRGADGDPNL